MVEQDTAKWAIDFNWYKQNNRSFTALVQKYLCAKCARQHKGDTTELPVARVLSMIRDCCSKSPGFINHRLPIMDIVFRLFLLNGNSPLTVEELRNELMERLGGDSYRTSPEILGQLLRNDNHYGIRETKK